MAISSLTDKHLLDRPLQHPMRTGLNNVPSHGRFPTPLRSESARD
jgi:hypothetical protein